MAASMQLTPYERATFRFEAKLTEIEDIYNASDDIEALIDENLPAAVQRIKRLLYDDTPDHEPTREDVERVESWDNALSQCLEDLGGARRAGLDTNSAERLYRCLSEIEANMMKGRPR